jgi:hypothetical protein
MKKMINCKTCGAEIASSAKSCPSCGAKNKPPIYIRVLAVFSSLFIAIVIVVFIAAIAGTDDTADSGNNSNQVVHSESSSFDGNCGIAASAEMGSSVLGLPELTISITNTTNKEISAIQYYIIPYDVYGNEIDRWTELNKRYTDEAIGAGQTDTVLVDFLENRVKTVKLYVYSVYFADGKEWGDKDATKSEILSNGAIIEVSGQS